MPKDLTHRLSRRERQIMDVVYHRGRATAQEVMEAIPDPPSYSAVRAMLRLLEEKGELRHEQDGLRYVYVPTVARAQAARTALKGVLRTFFDNSAEAALTALLDVSDGKMSKKELDRLSALIDQAKREGR